ncbi:MAG: hypothetical protein JSR54_03460 [Proteobacteria bacterium]|nr:hypothetical protein [Pseudomonadota bacterium]
MSDAASLVAGALRHKLTWHGAASLTRVEWQLLRVSTLLHALDSDGIERLISDAPLAELTGIADGLDAIGSAEASTLMHYTVREIGAANAPGLGTARAAMLRAIAGRLRGSFEPMRSTVEQQLLEFAFQQPELMPDVDADAPVSPSAA